MITKCSSFQSTKLKRIKLEQTYQVFQFLRCWNKFYPKKHGSSNYWVDKNHGHIMYAKENSRLTNPIAIDNLLIMSNILSVIIELWFLIQYQK